MGMPEPRSHAAKAGLSRAGVATVKNENRHPSEPNPNFAAIFPLALQTTRHMVRMVTRQPDPRPRCSTTLA